MDDIFELSQQIINKVTPPEKIAKPALAFQRVNESIQKLSEILELIKKHHRDKQEIVRKNGLDWWQKEQFDLHSRFFEKYYSTLSAMQFVCSFYDKLRNFRGKKNSNTKFIKNLESIETSNSFFHSSLDILEEARKFKSDYFVHSMNAGSVDWATISNRVYFLRDAKENKKSSGMFIGKVVVPIPDEKKIFQSLLSVTREVYLLLFND